MQVSNFRILITMIVIPYQMKHPMNNYPVQLFFKVSSIFNRIFADTVYTDENIAGQAVTFAIIESNYICEIIMLKKLLIYVQYIIV